MADMMADQLRKTKADRPDPLDAVLDASADAFALAGHGESAPGASDDLISQLADDEIERMMAAEGRGVGPSGRGAMPHDPADSQAYAEPETPALAEAPASGNVTADELDKLFQDLTASDPPSADGPKPAAEAAPSTPISPTPVSNAAAAPSAAAPLAASPTAASVVEEAEQQVRDQLDKLVDEINLIPGLAEDTAKALANPPKAPSERKPLAVAPPPAPTVVDEETQRQLNALFDELNAPAVSAPGAAAADELDDVQAAKEAAEPTPAASVGPTALAKTSEVVSVGELDQLLATEAGANVENAAHDSHAAADAEAEVSHAEKAAVARAAADAEKELEDAVTAAGSVTDHVPEESDDHAHADDPVVAADNTPVPAAVPIYLKPLEWLNMPLERVPEPARELVGKIAILTLVNALAVLTYVLFFRH